MKNPWYRDLSIPLGPAATAALTFGYLWVIFLISTLSVGGLPDPPETFAGIFENVQWCAVFFGILLLADSLATPFVGVARPKQRIAMDLLGLLVCVMIHINAGQLAALSMAPPRPKPVDEPPPVYDARIHDDLR